jgi:hypothetical protein
MTRRSVVAAFGALALLTAGIAAAESATVSNLKKEIAALKAEEKVVTKAIHAQYDAMINRDKVTEKILEQERAAVHRQEKQLLAVAQTDAERKAIRAQYDEIRALLTLDIKLDAKTIERLRAMRHAHIKHVEAAYNGKIKFLESELHSAQHASSGKKK